MKTKRRLVSLILLVVMMFSLSTVAFAAYSANQEVKWLYSDKYDLSLRGYIDLCGGNFICKDIYYYKGELFGDDVIFFPKETDNIYVRVLDDEGDVVKTVYLYNGYRSEISSIKYGYFSDYAELKIKCCDKYATIRSYD